MPELMMAIFGLQAKSPAVRTLQRLEKASIWFADQVLTVNLACKKIFASRSCAPAKIQVVMNSPDEKIFGFRRYVFGKTRSRRIPLPYAMVPSSRWTWP
jgi:hypothetical protein